MREEIASDTAASPRVPIAGDATPFGHLAVVAEAVEANRMDVYLDPIMGLADRKARHFELTVRLRDDVGQEIEPAEYVASVAGTGLLARIDAAKLERAAEIVQRLKTRQSKAALFSSLTGESLADENFLGSFADLLTDEDGMGARLVLSFSQAEARNFSTVHWQSISAMASIGLKFALEEVTDLDMDFEMLQQNGFTFVKLDAGVFLDGLPIAGGRVPPADICRHLAGLGFGLIVGGIVAEKDLARIHGFGAILGQGTLFGAPRSVALERPQRAA
ncbi:MAG: EAL domain-containing protein [Hyphomicrobiaceae bacterium]